jgi:hypothetical protein
MTQRSIVSAVLIGAGITTMTSGDVEKAEGAILEARRSLLSANRRCQESVVMDVFRKGEANGRVVESVLVGIASRLLASRTPSDLGLSYEAVSPTRLPQVSARKHDGRGRLLPPR